MEQNFQTSFIPKKPMINERVGGAKPISLFTIVAIFILFTILLVTGGFYFYRGIMRTSIAKKENDLNLAKNRFEPAKITELKALDRRLTDATEILSKHIAITPIFKVLQDITMKSVRYSKFDYTLGAEANGNVRIMLSGQTVGYRSVALQSDLFASTDEGKNFIDPVFSDLSLDDKGNVLFNLTFSVDPSFVDYKQMLQTGSVLDGVAPVAPTTP